VLEAWCLNWKRRNKKNIKDFSYALAYMHWVLKPGMSLWRIWQITRFLDLKTKSEWFSSERIWKILLTVGEGRLLKGWSNGLKCEGFSVYRVATIYVVRTRQHWNVHDMRIRDEFLKIHMICVSDIFRIRHSSITAVSVLHRPQFLAIFRQVDISVRDDHLKRSVMSW